MPNSRSITNADCDPVTHCIKNVGSGTTDWIITSGTHAAFCDPIPSNSHIIVQVGATLDINGATFAGYIEQTAGLFVAAY